MVDGEQVSAGPRAGKDGWTQTEFMQSPRVRQSGGGGRRLNVCGGSQKGKVQDKGKSHGTPNGRIRLVPWEAPGGPEPGPMGKDHCLHFLRGNVHSWGNRQVHRVRE